MSGLSQLVSQKQQEYQSIKTEMKQLIEQIQLKYTPEEHHSIFKTFKAQSELEYIRNKLVCLEVPPTTKWSDESMRPIREYTILDVPLEEIALLGHVKDTVADLLKYIEEKTIDVKAVTTEIQRKDPEIFNQYMQYQKLDLNRLSIKSGLDSVSGANLQALDRAKCDGHESLTETCRKAETYAKLTHRPEIWSPEVQKAMEFNERYLMTSRRAKKKEMNGTWAKIKEEMGDKWGDYEKARDIRNKLESTKHYFYRLKNKGSRRVTNEIIKNTLARGGIDLNEYFGYTLFSTLQSVVDYSNLANHNYRNYAEYSETFKRFIQSQDDLDDAQRMRYLMSNSLYGECASRPKVQVKPESETPLIDSFPTFRDGVDK